MMTTDMTTVLDLDLDIADIVTHQPTAIHVICGICYPPRRDGSPPVGDRAKAICGIHKPIEGEGEDPTCRLCAAGWPHHYASHRRAARQFSLPVGAPSAGVGRGEG